jgi:hypothetical protein
LVDSNANLEALISKIASESLIGDR